MPLSAGTRLGPYQILTSIGAGGMGEVYRAKDTRLDRTVAIKVLPEHLTQGPEARHRFEREARAVSSLNHPNICTIYEFDEWEGRPFIVMELLEGKTLRSRISEGGLKLDEFLDVAIQIADALDAAHSKGITHRDIKPGNIFITDKSQAKTLDFGLAKLNEDTRTFPSAAPTVSYEQLTSPGAALGTIVYMSPEQARGEELDARTDLFSFGVVLYEMASGLNPFLKSTPALTFDAILRLPPAPPVRPNFKLPFELNGIILKALEKQRDLRYQSAAEMRADLKRLKRDTESGRVFAAPAPARPIHRSKAAVIGAVTFLLGAAAVLFFTLRKPAIQPEYVQVTNFTDSATNPALSPDGRMLTFIRGESTFSGPGQIYVQLLPDGEPVQLTRDDTNKMGPVFSPDGSRIAYSAVRSMSDWDTRVVPALGGEARQLLPNASGLTWTGDRRVLFSEIKTGLHMGVVTATESRAEQHDVYWPASKLGMAHRSWLSPDRKFVILSEMEAGGWLPCRVVPLDGRSQGRAVGPPAAQCTYAAWSPDGRWVYFSANAGAGFHTWRQRFPDGKPEQITFGATEEEGIALAPDGRTFITSVGTVLSSIWVRDESGERQISSEGYAYVPSFSATGGELFYVVRDAAARSFTGGGLRRINLNTGQQDRLFPDFLLTHYDVSVDGKRVVFASADSMGNSRVWLTTLDGRSSPRQLGSLSANRVFFGVPGQILLHSSDGFIYKINEDGTNLQKALPDPVAYLMSVAPDRKWVVTWATAQPEAPAPTVAFPLDGSSPVLICRACANAGGPSRGHAPPVVSWSPDGRYFYIAFGLVSATISGAGQTFAIPVRSGQNLPPIPDRGLNSPQDVMRLPGVRVVPRRGVFSSPNPLTYAFTRVSAHRNLFRIRVP